MPDETCQPYQAKKLNHAGECEDHPMLTCYNTFDPKQPLYPVTHYVRSAAAPCFTDYRQNAMTKVCCVSFD